MAGKTIGELSESVSLDNTNLLAVSSDGNVLKKTTLSTLENSLTVSNFNATSKATIAGLAMPSGRYIDLTLGASGSTYTAPADGYVTVAKLSTANLQNITIDSNNWRAFVWANAADINIFTWLPVKNGATYQVYYNLGGATAYFRFYYASGSEPTA